MEICTDKNPLCIVSEQTTGQLVKLAIEIDIIVYFK
jgi:hypothetical protein